MLCGGASCGFVFCFSDPRTDQWPLVYSPLPVTLVFTSYLFLVALGPSCMRQRRRLELRGLLLIYNMAMVALSSYMFYEVRRQDWLLGKHLRRVWIPEPPDSRVWTAFADGLFWREWELAWACPCFATRGEYCPTVLDFLPFLNPPAIHEINTWFHSSWMNELQVENSPLGTDCVEDVEWPHFASSQASDKSISEDENHWTSGRCPCQRQGVGIRWSSRSLPAP